MRRRDKEQPQKVALWVALRACSRRQAMEIKANFAGADAAEVAQADNPKGILNNERTRKNDEVAGGKPTDAGKG